MKSKEYKQMKKDAKAAQNDPVFLKAHIKMLELKCEAWEEECKSMLFFLVEARAIGKYGDSEEFKVLRKQK